MSNWPPNYSETGEYVTVELLTTAHKADLEESAADGDMSALWYTSIPAPDMIDVEIERRLAERDAGRMLPFAIVDNATGKAVGMTTYMRVDEANKRVEIGSTWYRKSAQRGPLNTECKLLLLKNAFEILQCNKVEFRTHFINTQSRRAIERLGAKQDGILRSDVVMSNGTLRDTVVYSIIAGEWPMVEAHLRFQLSKPR